jgi:cytochrome b6-f complex iron-sulfur subunit
VLRGLAMTAASALVGCPGSESPPPDAPSVMPAMCGDNLCLDLGDATNAALTRVDGTLAVRAPHDTILVMRTSMTALQAVSDVCTHAGCAVVYDRVNKVLNCPCHGSRYALTGSVLRGPATMPLKRYTLEFDPGMNLVTIML